MNSTEGTVDYIAPEAVTAPDTVDACAAAGRWTNARAADWWAAHRSELRSGGAGASVGAGVGALAPHLTVTRFAD